jgi:dihydroxy-acid dehydratase
MNVIIGKDEIESRKREEESKGEKAYKPESRNREISGALKAYAATVSSADKGAVRII